MSEAALAPKMGPVTDAEWRDAEAWNRDPLTVDTALWQSIYRRMPGDLRSVLIRYILVRALRAHVPLEKLL